jgi:uncharacterized membrane protein YgdD (TMEM256/DUF423 family)
MTPPGRTFVVVGAVLAGLGVAAGAFAAHILADQLPEARLATFQTAAQYQVYHALALLVVGLLARSAAPPALRAVGWLFVAGTVLFSGSLYLLVLTDTPVLGAVTPFGGVAFLSGWALLAWYGLRERGAGGVRE